MTQRSCLPLDRVEDTIVAATRQCLRPLVQIKVRKKVPRRYAAKLVVLVKLSGLRDVEGFHSGDFHGKK